METFRSEHAKSTLGTVGSLVSYGVLVAVLVLSQACGHSSNLAPVGLQSIQIKPAGSLVPLAGVRQLKATGVFTDGTQHNLTASASWSSNSAPSTTTYISVSPGGLATGRALGTSTISASLDGALGVTSLTSVPMGLSSSTMGILFVPLNGTTVDVVYLPQSKTTNAQGLYTVQEVNLDADQLAPLPVTSALIASIPMPSGYVPNATAASQTSSKIVVISYTSLDVQVIDASNASNDPASNTIINTLTLSLPTQSTTLNGISCMICGIVINPLNDQAVISTATGFYTFTFNEHSPGPVTITPTPLATGFPAGNFTLNPPNSLNPMNNTGYSYLLSPGVRSPGQGEIQLLNLADNTATTNAALGVTAQVGVALDLVDNVGIVQDSNNNQVLLKLNTITTDPIAGTWSAPSTSAQLPSGCNVPNQPPIVAYAVGIGAQSATPKIFTSQTGSSCVALEDFQCNGTQPEYGFHPMPDAPDGFPFINSKDPNAIATFISVYDNKFYGLLVNDKDNQSYIAKIDLFTSTLDLDHSTCLPNTQNLTLRTRTPEGLKDAVIFLPTTQ